MSPYDGAGFRKVAYITWDLCAGELVNSLHLNVILDSLNKVVNTMWWVDSIQLKVRIKAASITVAMYEGRQALHAGEEEPHNAQPGYQAQLNEACGPLN
jgi:hypothetical protein